jgi:hypothetical protein
VLTCKTCAVDLVVPTSPVARLREVLEAFFTVHDGCATTIDLSQGGGLRLPSPPALDHAVG